MTDRYAVIGNPVAHSQSPRIHAIFARALHEDVEYGSILGRPGHFVDDVNAFRQSGGRGLNVTVPFKMDAFAFATRRSERATQSGAVNTLKFDAGDVIGDNTDGAGLVRDIRANLGFSIAGRFMPAEKLGMSFDLGAAFVGQALLLELPLLAIFAVAQTLIAAFAKTYREAQTYLGFLMILPALPTMLMAFMPVKPTLWMYAVPLLGQQLGLSQLLRGGSVGMAEIGIALVCGFAVALLIGLLTAHVYRSERLGISV